MRAAALRDGREVLIDQRLSARCRAPSTSGGACRHVAELEPVHRRAALIQQLSNACEKRARHAGPGAMGEHKVGFAFGRTRHEPAARIEPRLGLGRGAR